MNKDITYLARVFRLMRPHVRGRLSMSRYNTLRGKYGGPSCKWIYNHVGSWKNSLKFTGVNKNWEEKWVKESLRAAQALSGKYLTARHYQSLARRVNGPSYPFIYYRYKSWNNALKFVGLPIFKVLGPRDRIIKAIRDAARISEGPLTSARYLQLRNKVNGPNHSWIRRCVGGWVKAVKLAGLDQSYRSRCPECGKVFSLLKNSGWFYSKKRYCSQYCGHNHLRILDPIHYRDWNREYVVRTGKIRSRAHAKMANDKVGVAIRAEEDFFDHRRQFIIENNRKTHFIKKVHDFTDKYLERVNCGSSSLIKLSRLPVLVWKFTAYYTDRCNHYYFVGFDEKGKKVLSRFLIPCSDIPRSKTIVTSPNFKRSIYFNYLISSEALRELKS